MAKAFRILVVEDRESLRRMMERALLGEGYAVETADSAEAAADRLGQGHFDLVLTDLKLPGASGLEVLKTSRALHPGTPVVVLTAYGTVKTAVEAMKLGAIDFLEKPVEIDDLYELVESLSRGVPRQEVFQPPGGPSIIGGHPRMRAALRLLERVAATDSTVLLTGESGTGKELFARALHALSARRDGPFIGLNCAAIPETLLENELFGHEKGAFTGAHRRQPGRFEAAAGGTLLLDEIGELPLATQAKVLRVLEERTFERIGGSRTLKADVRLVAATNRDLGDMVEQGHFREDLYYRLEVFPIELPPLRDRVSDIPAIAEYLVARIAQRQGLPAKVLSEDALQWLGAQSWPGNIRQLANLLERAVIVGEGNRLDAPLLERCLKAGGTSERARVEKALRESQGDRRRAASILGVSTRTLQRRIREYDLSGFPEYRD